MKYDEIRKKLEGEYAKNSIDIWVNCSRKIMREAFGDSSDSFDPKKLYDLKRFVDYVNKFPNPSSKKTHTNSILHMLKIVNDKVIVPAYQELFRQYCQEADEDEDWSPYKEKEERKLKSLDNLKERARFYAKVYEKNPKSFPKYYNALVTKLYTEIPPLRPEEWLSCEFEDDEKNNFIDLDTGIVTIRVYKTMNTHGDRQLQLPESLNKFIKIGKEEFGMKYVLPQQKNPKEHSSISSFSSKLKNLFDGCNAQLLRKIYISEKVPEMDHTARKNLARFMGHTVKVQEFRYNKN